MISRQQENDTEVQNLNKDILQLKDCIKDYILSIDTLETKVNDLQKVVSDRDTTIMQLQEGMNGRGREMLQKDEAIEDLQHTLAAIQHQMMEKGKEYEEGLIDIYEKHKRQMQIQKEDIQKAHVRECEQMVFEFDMAQQQYKQTIVNLQAEMKAWQEKYENRESRLEDVDMIRDLKTDIDNKKRQIQMMKNELEFIKKEVINREDVYNRIFNTKPNVGTMKPLDMKKKVNGKLPPLHNSTPSIYENGLMGNLKRASSASSKKSGK
jgi:chromosome segregation ATPase